MEATCNANPGELVCANYARYCNREDIGCKFYTSTTRGFNVPAKVEPEDYCSGQCVGYNIYVQAETAFEETKDPADIDPDDTLEDFTVIFGDTVQFLNDDGEIFYEYGGIDQIPGYEITILLGASAISILALVYVIMKKRKR